MAMMGFGGLNDMFGEMDRMMNHMDQMMNGMMGAHSTAIQSMAPPMSPFGATGSMGMGPMGGLMAHMGGFGGMGHIMGPMGGAGMMMNPFAPMQQMMMSSSGTPNGVSFSSSSVTTITADGSGRPQVRHQTNSTRNIGGLRETKETLKDSRTGVQKMSLGRHIDERGHVMHRQRNVYEGTEEASDDFINLDESEVPHFDSEWRTRARGIGADRGAPQIQELTEGDYNSYSRNSRLALPCSSGSGEAASSGPIIEEVDDDDEVTAEEVRTARSTPSGVTRFRELPPSPNLSRYGKHARSHHTQRSAAAPSPTHSPSRLVTGVGPRSKATSKKSRAHAKPK